MLTDGIGFDNNKIAVPGVTGGDLSGEAAMDNIATYQKHHISYFPLRKKSKKPVTEWTVFQTRPPIPEENNDWKARKLLGQIAIVTGKVSRIIVLDEDDPPVFQAWLKEHGYKLPHTPTVKTSTFKDDQGNIHHKFHYYFKHPGGKIKNMIKKIPGADIKADGGYVVAPPSVHPNGEQYEWCFGLTLDDYPDTPVPPWLLEYLDLEVAPQVGLAQGDLLPPDEDWVTVAWRGVPVGERNSVAAQLSGFYLGGGNPEPRVLQMLLAWNLTNKEPLPEKDIQKIVASIARTEARKRIREGASQANTQIEPEPKTDLPWEEQRQAALQGLGDLLGMPIANVRVSPGSEGLYEIILSTGVSIIITIVEICSQKKFHNCVYAASLISPSTVAKEKNGQGGWKAVLKTLATWAERVDAGPEATLRGEVQEFINNYLSKYRGLSCFERGKPIPHHVAFFILKQEGGPAVFMRLDEIFFNAKQMGYNITRKKMVGVLSTLGHLNQRLKWPGVDSMVWQVNMATIPDEIRSKVYKMAMFDGDD
jgi:hypothetical protein